MTPKEQAALMSEQGETRTAIALALGVHRNTVANWLDPVRYIKNLEHNRHHAKVHPLVYENLTQEQKDTRNNRQRFNYHNKPGKREQMNAYARQYRKTVQGAISLALRRILLGHRDAWSPVHESLAEAVTGMSRHEFTLKFGGEGHMDHIVPLCAFKLIDPVQLAQANHNSNLQLLPRTANESKGRKKPHGLKIETLPYFEASVPLCQNLINHVLRKLAADSEGTARYKRLKLTLPACRD